MDRTEAAAQIDEGLNLWNAQGIEGRCPRCEGLLSLQDVAFDEVPEDMRDIVGAADADDGQLSFMRWHHADDCAIHVAFGEAIVMAVRWGFQIERVRLTRLVNGKPAYFVGVKRMPD